MENLIERFFNNKIFKIGFWLFVIGTAPLLLTVFLIDIGLVSKHANPVGLGLLFFFTFPPSLLLIAIGAWQVLFGKKN